MSSNGHGEIVPVSGSPHGGRPLPPAPAPPRFDTGPISGGDTLPDDTGRNSPIRKLHQLLRGRYHWAILLALLLGAGGAAGGWYLQKPRFSSNGALIVVTNMTYIVEKYEDSGPMKDLKYFMGEQVAKILSERNLLRALENPDLRKYGLTVDLGTVNGLLADLEVEARNNRIDVIYTSEDPTRARTIVRSIVGAYMDLFGEADQKSQQQKFSTLDELEIKLNSERDALVERRMAIQRAAGVDVEAYYQAQMVQLQKLEALRQTAQTLLAEHGVNLNEAPALKDVNQMNAEELSLRDTILAELINVRKTIEAQMDVERSMGRGEQHRVVRQLQAQLDTVNQQIALRMTQVKEAGLTAVVLNPDQIDPLSMRVMSVDELRRFESQLTARADDLRTQIDALAEKREQIARIDEQMNRVKRDLGQAVDRREKLRVEYDNAPARVSVVEEGTTPKGASNKGKRKQLAALGALAGMSAGVSLVLLLGLLNPKLRNIDDARMGLHQVRMLGILPSLPEDLADPMQASIAAHCVHQVRAMLQIGVAPDQHRVYSVTSPGAGTGKTSLTLALGLSFAAADSKTLLVDCDLVGGGLTRRIAAVVRRRIGYMLQKQGLVTAQQIETALRYSQEKGVRLGQALVDLHYLTEAELDTALNLQEQSLVGVMDACNGEPFDHCIAETGVKNLWVLPTGTAMARHAASLSPTAVRRLVDQARGRFDTVLIDTGPVLGSLEASIVAGTVDGVVLIVARGDQRAAADKSVEYLHSIRANLLGIVFNRAEHQDIERSSYTSLTSISSLRPDDGAVVEGEVIDTEASARLGPVGSAVATNSRIARNGRGRNNG